MNFAGRSAALQSLSPIPLSSGRIVSPELSASPDVRQDTDGPPSVNDACMSQLESFLKHLIERGFVDNEDDDSETIHRFLEIYEQFDVDGETFEANGAGSPGSSPHNDSFARGDGG